MDDVILVFSIFVIKYFRNIYHTIMFTKLLKPHPPLHYFHHKIWGGGVVEVIFLFLVTLKATGAFSRYVSKEEEHRIKC